MASKKDLVEGQAFSRRRLITAFVSGSPGGREVEPGKPLRAVVGGVVLSAVLVVGALAVGLLSPTLPNGWNDDSLVIAKDSGARYVALQGTLYPVINTTSARLLVPSGFKVVSAADDKLTDSPRGDTVGIIGAPDALPTESSLIRSGWASCTSRSGGVLTRIGRGSVTAKASDQAVLANVDGQLFMVDNGFRYPIAQGNSQAVLRAFALDTATIQNTTAAWVTLFAPGPELAPLSVPNAGQPVTGVGGLPPGVAVGTVVFDAADTQQRRKYVVEQGGTVTQLSDLAYALYKLGSGSNQSVTVGLTTAQLSSLATGAAIVPDQWPTLVPTLMTDTPCAVLTSGTGTTRPAVALGSTTRISPVDGDVATAVDPGAGALIRAIGAASVTNGPVVLIDQTGTAFPVTGSDSDKPLERLGYTDSDIVPVPQAWLALFKSGPTLSVTGARTKIAGTGQTGK